MCYKHEALEPYSHDYTTAGRQMRISVFSLHIMDLYGILCFYHQRPWDQRFHITFTQTTTDDKFGVFAFSSSIYNARSLKERTSCPFRIPSFPGYNITLPIQI